MEMNCPKCIGKLSQESVRNDEIYKDPVMSGEGLEKQIDYYRCFVCGGIWIDSSVLEEVVAEKRHLIHTAAPYKTGSISRADGRPLSCPRCASPLARKSAPEDENVLCDYCEKCRGLWLDPGKIDRIEDDNVSFRDMFVSFLDRLGYDRDIRRLG